MLSILKESIYNNWIIGEGWMKYFNSYPFENDHTGPHRAKIKVDVFWKGQEIKKYLFFRLVLNAHFVVFSENLNFGLQKFIIIICNSRWPAEVLSLYRPNCKPEVIGRWRWSRMGAWLTRPPSMVIITFLPIFGLNLHLLKFLILICRPKQSSIFHHRSRSARRRHLWITCKYDIERKC